ncbi:putative fungal lipase-like domain, alpha/Beta hydrolase [Helianthus annuus]|nr:putative fungal lipase-like domain, alpha/Beta hydrolase [Helianthus annuus]
MSNDNRTNPDHRRSVAACLVQGVYILERDHQESVKHLKLLLLHGGTSSSLTYTVNSKTTPIHASSVPSTNPNTHLHNTPRLTSIAFRGTLIKGNAFSRDLELDIHIIKNGLHLTSRFDIGMQAVRKLLRSQALKSNIWLTGHSLGSAMALLAGKQMTKTGIFLDSYLLYFNLRFQCLM